MSLKVGQPPADTPRFQVPWCFIKVQGVDAGSDVGAGWSIHMSIHEKFDITSFIGILIEKMWLRRHAFDSIIFYSNPAFWKVIMKEKNNLYNPRRDLQLWLFFEIDKSLKFCSPSSILSLHIILFDFSSPLEFQWHFIRVWLFIQYLSLYGNYTALFLYLQKFHFFYLAFLFPIIFFRSPRICLT